MLNETSYFDFNERTFYLGHMKFYFAFNLAKIHKAINNILNNLKMRDATASCNK